MIESILKKLFHRYVSTNYLEKVYSQSIYKNKFKELNNIKEFSKREDLWKNALDIYEDQAINLLEFGVWEGYSIKKFAEFNLNKDSYFYGFDSFEGLPSHWNDSNPKGTFDVNGVTPNYDDKRIVFIKGWFQNSLTKFLNRFKKEGNLIVHYDADLYNSTLFCLSKIDSLKKPYIAIFDEFYYHELLALANYQDAFGAEIEFIGKTGKNQVSCKITPCDIYKIS